MEEPLGWMVFAGGGSSWRAAPGWMLCDSSGFAGIVDALEPARRALAPVGRHVVALPAGLAVTKPASNVAVFRRSSHEVDLLGAPFDDVTDDDWAAISAAEREELANVILPSAIVGLAPLNEFAFELPAALPSLRDEVALRTGNLHSGMLLRIDPGVYVLTYARHMLDMDADLELFIVSERSANIVAKLAAMIPTPTPKAARDERVRDNRRHRRRTHTQRPAC